MGKKKLTKKDELILSLQEEVAELSELNNALLLTNILNMACSNDTEREESKENTKVVLPEIESVIYDNPKVIICWSDQTTTVAKCMPEDTYSKDLGYFICVCKKALGNNKFRELLGKHLNFTQR